MRIHTAHCHQYLSTFNNTLCAKSGFEFPRTTGHPTRMRSAALFFGGEKYDVVRCANYKGLSYDRGQAFLVRLRLRGSTPVHVSIDTSCFNEILLNFSTGTSGMTYRVNSKTLLTEVQSSVKISVEFYMTIVTFIHSLREI